VATSKAGMQIKQQLPRCLKGSARTNCELNDFEVK
jgi:hypothetical protein